MSQESRKAQIEELKRQRAELTQKIQFLEKQSVIIGKVKMDDSGIAIFCENKNYTLKGDFWRSVIVRERKDRNTGEVKERSEQEIKHALGSLIDDLTALYQTL